MAEIKVEKKSAAQYTWVWVALSLVLMGGFFYWLAVSSEPTTLQVVEDDEAAEDAGVLEVHPAEFASNPRGYPGQEIRLRNIIVASRLGAHAFWTELPNDQPFLVRLDDAILAEGASVQGGQRVTVVGTVHQMTDSILAAWEEQGAIDEATRPEAEFATDFLEARRISGGGGPAAGG